MDKTMSSFTVLFEAPFWVGIYECECNSKYEVCKFIFGTEPKDNEVYEFFLKNYNQFKFGLVKNTSRSKALFINPKRMQRKIKKELSVKGVGTKAQQALKLLHEQKKIERKETSVLLKEERKKYKFQLKQEKRNKKHRGH